MTDLVIYVRQTFPLEPEFGAITAQQRERLQELASKYERAIWFLQDIAAMSRKVGSETAAHALAQLGEPRERSGD